MSRRPIRWVVVLVCGLGVAAVTGPVAVSAAQVRPAASFVALRQGSTGTRVTALQTRLKALGYRATVNGRFGPITRAAVMAFQRAGGLPVDGVVGARTWHALGLDSPPAPVSPPTAPTTTTSTVAPSTTTPGIYHHPNANVERWHAAALAAGWAEKDWKHLSCVIQRESKGNPNAYNASTASGLLQIVYRAHKAWIGPDPSVLFDGPTNLAMGYRMFHDIGWRPWSGSITLCSR